MSYLPLSSYGVIGDLHTAALVGSSGSVDWCCLPRFDSESLFAALLDQTRGGYWRIAPAAEFTSEQHYLTASNVLETVFRVPGGGVLHLTDFMPVGPTREGRSRIFRRVRAVRGTVPVRVEWAPRFDYATKLPKLTRRRYGVLATDRDNDVTAVVGPADLQWHCAGGVATAELPLREGETAWFILTFDEDELHPVESHEPDAVMERTIRWWDFWSSQIRYAGPFRREVERSALALKLCCYEPTGAIVAAPTTSLPESYTGGRNWDYRYVWLRDSAYVLYAFEALGFEEETDSFLRFLKRVCRREGDDPLQIMYAVDGERDLPERVLGHLEGYRGAGPVRIGNGAVNQFQLDVYGEVLATLDQWSARRSLSEGTWHVVQGLVDQTMSLWRRPDQSIWEPRTAPRHHVASKVMAWVALDRGAKIAERYGRAEEAARWRAEAEAVHAEVMDRGWDPVRGTFVQAYGEPHLDAALLVVPKFRFLPRSDPRVRSTLAAIRRELGTSCEELIYRYRAADGLAGEEGAFVTCSFWMIQNLAMVGELDEAERLFRNLVRRFEPLGLAAEEIDPATGEQMGNYPQALSHAALINTAVVIERLRSKAD
ncbi:MAG TPA: glycoside hydrolase family 15 protein [Gemmatimonadales bacterium]|nr:glycoside hydrolase family 15 protein [Gemmatimonadales bacterium]